MTAPTYPPPARLSLPIAEVHEPRPRIEKHRVMAAVVAAYALAAAVAAAFGDRLPVPTWLALHLLVLGAATNAVFVWSRHFAQALLHARLGSERGAHARLGVLNLGIVAVLVGVPYDGPALVALGAVAVVGAVVAHGSSLVLMARRNLLPGKLRGCVHYYVASATALAVGATLGGLLGTGTSHSSGLHLAHAHANLLGWLGLAVLGTQFMLWPAVLRTRMAEDAPRVARAVLPLTVVGLGNALLALIAFPGVTGSRIAAAGVTLYLAGVALSLRPFLVAARQRRPHSAASWMLAAGTGWFVVALGVDAVALARSPQEASAALDLVVPLLALGLVAQALVGALTFLLPVTLGSGPVGNRRLTAVLETGWVARLVLANAGITGVVLTEADTRWRQAALALTLVSLVSAVPLIAAAVQLSRTPHPQPVERAPRDWTEHVALGGILAVVAALVVVVSPGPSTQPITGPATVVDVTLTEFAIAPARLEVARDERIVLRVRNAGSVAHDLSFPGGRATPRLAPGQSADLDLGVVTREQEGWCTLAGHRAAGMTMTVVLGEASATGAHLAAPGAAPAPEWKPYDPRLKPAPGGSEHRLTLRAQETDVEVAPGVRQRMWTFNGTVPGPALRGKVGDTFVVTLVNGGTIPHSLDFHASQVAPDRLMKPIPPGGSLVYSFKAERAGAWLYHCSADPLIQHVAMGMYGALVVDPPDLAAVDTELLLVQSEIWKGDEPPVARMTAAEEDLVVFNGYADQYAHAPVDVEVGDRVRIWLVNAGPSESSAFHVIGTQFDTVYEDGRFALRPGEPGGAQALDVPPGSGGFVELVVPEPGSYVMVTHRLADAARGATGLLVAD